MKVSSIKLENFKRFTNLTVSGLPENAKLIIIVGPNGSGKSSLFDAFNTWYRGHSGFGFPSDETYYRKDARKSYNRNNSVEVIFYDHPQDQPVHKKSMYFRTSYRNDPDFNISNFGKVGAPHEQLKVMRFIDNDQTVSENYQRLIYSTVTGVYSESNNGKKVEDLREELIGKVKKSMLNVFDDLFLNNIGDPLGDGSFRFKKGDIDSYHYKNLSGGEKAAFDLLLDLNIKIEHYDNSVYFIDEPDSHMHTVLQGKLIKEIHRVVPKNSQMWITTHSLGVMRMAKKLAQNDPGSVAFIDFGEMDFDIAAEIKPASIDGIIWEKFLSVALDDFAQELNPEILIMCEGDINGIKRKNFDSFLYGKLFSKKYPHVTFVSGGSCSELENPDHKGFKLLSEVLGGTKIARLIDRDDKSEVEVEELERIGVYSTSRRNIECYLFDDELIKKLVLDNYQPQLIEDIPDKPKSEDEKKAELTQLALKIKNDAIAQSISRSNAPDDIKSASSDIYLGLKKLLKLTRCGNNSDMFMRDTMSELMTEDTAVYQEMESSVILKIINL